MSLSIGLTAVGSFLESCGSTKKMAGTAPSTGFGQQPLPYRYDALEDVIDARTMEIHYSKHAAAYSKALNEAVAAEAPQIKTTEELLANISRYTLKMRNNAGGHYNHELFWKSMRPKRTDNKPAGKLLTAIEKTFGSFSEFKKQLGDAGTGRFGSGWAWLYIDGNKSLKVGSTANQDNPLMNVSEIKGFPLLGLDVWEHAYYLKYQNKRADYITNWWNVVNWDFIQQRYEAVL
ncbi:MAG: superoxide dismutase [Chitinophagaceae bacterium]|nr:MAG: superoxide dismutase [Chitinophagaceae bacterium]